MFFILYNIEMNLVIFNVRILIKFCILNEILWKFIFNRDSFGKISNFLIFYVINSVMK